MIFEKSFLQMLRKKQHLKFIKYNAPDTDHQYDSAQHCFYYSIKFEDQFTNVLVHKPAKTNNHAF
jgi:hypothetical protein